MDAAIIMRLRMPTFDNIGDSVATIQLDDELVALTSGSVHKTGMIALHIFTL